MALYSYQGFSRQGKKVGGSIDASSVGHAREMLVRMEIFPTNIMLETAATRQKFSLRQLFQKKIGAKDKIFFTKQLSVLLKAGVPLVQALELLAEQSEGALKNIVIALKDGIKEGRSLADGLSAYPKIFDTTYIQLVKAGEASGRLEVILDRLTVYLERNFALNKKIKSALNGPLIQLGLVAIIVVILLTAVVPQIAETFAREGQELPWNTRFLMASSSFFTHHYTALAIIMAITIGLFIWWKRTPSGARLLDKIKLSLPFIGYFARMRAVIQFSSTLGMLIEGGVNLAEALNIVCKIVDNRILVDTLNAARENIIKQGRVAEYLKQTGIFPPLAIYLINTGEQSGQLDTMLLTVAQTYEAEFTEFTDGLADKIDPIMKVVMGLIVGFIVLSIATPLQKVSQIAEF